MAFFKIQIEENRRQSASTLGIRANNHGSVKDPPYFGKPR